MVSRIPIDSLTFILKSSWAAVGLLQCANALGPADSDFSVATITDSVLVTFPTESASTAHIQGNVTV